MKEISSFLMEEFLKHLADLTPAHQPLWGKMSAQHLVEHLSALFDISTGKVEMTVLDTPEKVAKSKRHVFQYKNPFPKNLRVPILPAKPQPLKYETMEEAKEELTKSMAAFFEYFEQNPDKTTIHSFLGPLTFKEWVFFHTKHISHHLTQFGLMDGEITPY